MSWNITNIYTTDTRKFKAIIKRLQLLSIMKGQCEKMPILTSEECNGIWRVLGSSSCKSHRKTAWHFPSWSKTLLPEESMIHIVCICATMKKVRTYHYWNIRWRGIFGIISRRSKTHVQYTKPNLNDLNL